MPTTLPVGASESRVEARNRRTALLLIGWVLFLCLVSVIVIWVRN